jgi:hypothetical protein
LWLVRNSVLRSSWNAFNVYLILDKAVDELVKQAASININEVASEEETSMKENDEDEKPKGKLYCCQKHLVYKQIIFIRCVCGKEVDPQREKEAEKAAGV